MSLITIYLSLGLFIYLAHRCWPPERFRVTPTRLDSSIAADTQTPCDTEGEPKAESKSKARKKNEARKKAKARARGVVVAEDGTVMNSGPANGGDGASGFARDGQGELSLIDQWGFYMR